MSASASAFAVDWFDVAPNGELPVGVGVPKGELWFGGGSPKGELFFGGGTPNDEELSVK